MTASGAKMKPTYLTGGIVAIAFVAGGSAFAEGRETEKMRAMIAGIEFITQNSSLEYAGEALPGMTIVAEEELRLRFNAAAGQVISVNDRQSFDRVSAFYDRDTNEIYLADADSIMGPDLLHELVHFMQDINGKDDLFGSRQVCLEAQAYDLQAIWQTEQGIEPASKPEYGFVTMLYGVCNDADFSWIDSEYSTANKRAGAALD
jgi:hypothetical protein